MSDIYILTSLAITLLVFSLWWFLPRIVYMLATGHYGVGWKARTCVVGMLLLIALLQGYLVLEMWQVVFRILGEIN